MGTLLWELHLTEASNCIKFENNNLLSLLLGEQDKHLQRIEDALDVSIYVRGNLFSITGTKEKVIFTKQVLESLYHQLEQGVDVGMGEVDAAIRMATKMSKENKSRPLPILADSSDGDFVIKTRKKHIRPYTPNQQLYLETLLKKELVFGVGPAGTGKTYLAVAIGVSMFLNHEVDRIILSRPAVEAGEKLGFLPGDMKEKVDPYLQPLYDALHDMLPAEQVQKHLENKEIEIAPLAFMRGRTLNNSFVILDEAQNATSVQMKMFLTRLGEGSRMVVAGDLTQTDLPRDIKSGLRDALEKLSDITDIGRVNFDAKDVVRHPLTAKIVHAYEQHNKNDRWSETP